MSRIFPTENEFRSARWLLVLIALRACRSCCARVRKVLQWITFSMLSALGSYWTQEVHIQWRIQVLYGFIATPKLIQWFVNWLALVMIMAEYCYVIKNPYKMGKQRKISCTHRSWLHPSELQVKYQISITKSQRGELATDGEGRVVHSHLCWSQRVPLVGRKLMLA